MAKIVKAVKAGPLANGFERGKGRIVHAIKSYTDEVYCVPSLCGDIPAIQWSERPDSEITCKKCLRLSKEYL